VQQLWSRTLRPSSILPALAACLAIAACAPSVPAEGPGISRAAVQPAEEATRAVAGPDRACLAEAVYFEARGTGERGQAAVAHVVLNRAEHPEFPDDVCGVIADRCQFSYRCNGRSNALSNAEARAEATRIATAVLSGDPDPTGGALFFHSSQARATGWFQSRPRVGQFGGNVFYR
jgi:N-acetylmuramoyl-L-alanine amidase